MRRAGLLAVLLAAALPACGGRRVEHTEVAPVVRPGDVVVATVDGHPITARRVTEHAAALGRDARAALDDLVAFELLAQEAARRAAGAAPEVAEVRKREMARRFVKVEFEARHRLEDIPEADLRPQYERNRHLFDHPRILSVVSALFSARRGKATAAEDAKARARAQELTVRLRAEQPKDAKTVRLIMDTFIGPDVPMRIDELRTYKGAEADPDWLKATLTLREPGQISDPVRSVYGWHVTYLADVLPEKHTPTAEALAVVRREFHPVWQKTAFERFLEQALAGHTVETHGERLRPAAHAAIPAAPTGPATAPGATPPAP
ncbi:MAG TPA: peptidylprolyl isomerase [Polyangia bacterium]|jgi:peptidyl-prolyl cis-trans isomerase C